MENQTDFAAKSPSGEDIKKISAFSKSELKPEDVFTFEVTLCDNDIDRDNERFTTDCLYGLCELMKGRTGICDHDAKAENQLARLYDCRVEECSEKNSLGETGFKLVGSAYMLRLQSTADLIKEIEGGIKKEVSISCAVAKQTCSICGKDIRVCGHLKGRTYRGRKCYASLSDPTDGYEWSFVAIPAQKHAGVNKALSAASDPVADGYDVKKAFETGDFELCPDTVCLKREDIEEISRRSREQSELAKAGREYISKTKDSILRMMKLINESMSEATQKSIVEKLSQSELYELERSLNERCAALYPLRPQTAAENGTDKAPSMDRYKI